MLPNPLEEIARKLDEYNKRLSHLERLEPGGAFQLILNVTFAAPAASVTFAAIPGTFAHLLILFYARTDRVATNAGLFMQFNGDVGANYDHVEADIRHVATVATNEALAATQIRIATIDGSTAPANTFSTGEIRINHYANTINHKSAIAQSGHKPTDVAAGPRTLINSGWWRDTAAIISVLLFPQVGPNFIAGSRFGLYGIRG